MDEPYSTTFANSNKTKFSGDWLKFERISNLWSACHELACNGKLMQWNYKLDRVWLELVSHAEKGNEKEKGHEEQFADLTKKIIATKDSKELYSLLVEKETLLRKLEAKAGLSNKMMEEEDEEF